MEPRLVEEPAISMPLRESIAAVHARSVRIITHVAASRDLNNCAFRSWLIPNLAFRHAMNSSAGIGLLRWVTEINAHIILFDCVEIRTYEWYRSIRSMD